MPMAKFKEFVGLVDDIERIQRPYRAAVGAVQEELDLSGMEMSVLSAVAEAGTPMTVPQIGRRLGHARQVVQRSANVLIGRGLIEARDNPDHKRAVLLFPSKNGVAAKARADERAEELVAPFLEPFDADTLAEISRTMRAVRAALEAATRELGTIGPTLEAATRDIHVTLAETGQTIARELPRIRAKLEEEER